MSSIARSEGSPFNVWAVIVDTTNLDNLEDLYNTGLAILDTDSAAHLRKYYHRIDSIRGMIGRLLPRLLLKDRGIPLSQMSFRKTAAGKPYIATPGIDPPVGYNITHDNGVVAMAFSSGSDLWPEPPAYRIGIDVMLLQLPKRDTLNGFIGIFHDQLTPLEREILSPPGTVLSREEIIRRFYLIWTLKEAYTKALGLGLGFDFSRIEYDVPRDVVRIDNVVPQGWEFCRFAIQGKKGDLDEDYVGIIARYVGGEHVPGDECVVKVLSPGPWLKLWQAPDFMKESIAQLSAPTFSS